MMKAKKVASPAAGATPKGVDELNVSVADRRSKDYPAVKTSGIKMRGTGAATKGTMSRGPMA
jgi:hypothetical protein